MGFLAGLAMFRCTLALIRTTLPESRNVTSLFFITVWGGGFFAIAHLLLGFGAQLGLGESDMATFVADEFGTGWWFLNWGRNVALANEAFYHLLAVAGFLCIIRRKWKLGVAASLLLATASPWTGLQYLATLVVWFTVNFFRPTQDIVPRIFQLSIILISALFTYYYAVFLHSYIEHRELVDTWKLHWPSSPIISILAYCLVLPAALRNLWQSRHSFTIRHSLFTSLAAVSLALEYHDIALPAVQPLHFTRGYFWFALIIIGLPEWDRFLTRTIGKTSNLPVKALGLAAVITFCSADNIRFLTQQASRCDQSPIVHVGISPQLREIYAWASMHRLSGTLLCGEVLSCYLAATYSPLRPLVGSLYLTPQISQKWRVAKAWYELGQTAPELSQIDFILIKNESWPKWLKADQIPPGWYRIKRNQEFTLIGRKER